MDGKTLQILIAMCAYMALVILIGLYYVKRSNKSSEDYFIGGRTMGPWVAAMSAEASDMSGWLLMGLPGVAYWLGLSDAIWTAIGLAIGTYLNWLLVSRRLRNYSLVANNAITIPDYLSNRFHENKKVIMSIAALFILVFFTIYAASCFVTCGKLFSTLFGQNYQLMVVCGALFVLIYTFLGGFLAESASDFMQAIVMLFALIVVLVVGISAAGGWNAVMDNARAIPGFLDFFGIASPVTVDGVQQLGASGEPLFGDAGAYGLLTIISTMSWGLGYFGMPQVLLRFIAIRKADELVKSRRIATVWVLLSLGAAVLIGIVGRALYPSALLSSNASERIFIEISSNLLPPLFAGIVMSGILAATISSSDSYLLIAASAFAKNIYQRLIRKDADDREIMRVTRIVLLTITLLGVLIAMDENSVIFTLVSFAWAGFGATFGPIMLFSLFWKRTTRSGALAGMVSGASCVFIWRMLIKPMGGVLGIYELLPSFLVSCLFIIVVSLLSKKPDKLLTDEFEKVAYMGKAF